MGNLAFKYWQQIKASLASLGKPSYSFQIALPDYGKSWISGYWQQIEASLGKSRQVQVFTLPFLTTGNPGSQDVGIRLGKSRQV